MPIIWLVCFVLELLVGFSGTRNLMKRENVHWSLKVLFFLSIVLVLITALSLITGHILLWTLSASSSMLWDTLLILLYLWSYSFNFMFFCLVGTLVIRLHLSFKGSVYELTAVTRACFSFIFLIMILMQIWMIALGVIRFHTVDEEEVLSVRGMGMTVSRIYLILYTLTGAIGVGLFCSKLLKLTKSRVHTSSMYDDFDNATFEDLHLISRQIVIEVDALVFIHPLWMRLRQNTRCFPLT